MTEKVTSNVGEKPIYPLNKIVIDLCTKAIDKNFEKKGNSWTNRQYTPARFLMEKLQEEYAEFVLEMYRYNSYQIAKEGADLINIISMLMNRYGSTSETTRQSKEDRS